MTETISNENIQSNNRSPSSRSVAVLRRVDFKISDDRAVDEKSLVLYKKSNSSAASVKSGLNDLRQRLEKNATSKKKTLFLTRRSLEAYLPKHSWFEPRPTVDRIVGLTIHCFALSMVVLLGIGARFFLATAQLILFMAIHSSVEKGQITATSLSEDVIRQSTICRLGSLYVILARIDHKLSHRTKQRRQSPHRHSKATYSDCNSFRTSSRVSLSPRILLTPTSCAADDEDEQTYDTSIDQDQRLGGLLPCSFETSSYDFSHKSETCALYDRSTYSSSTSGLNIMIRSPIRKDSIVLHHHKTKLSSRSVAEKVHFLGNAKD